MKKTYYLILSFILTANLSFAQNTFPSTGNVGIGTTSPGNLLDVTGAGPYVINSNVSFNADFLQDHTNVRGIFLGFDKSGQIGVLASGAVNNSPSNMSFWNYSGSNWFEAMRRTSGGNLGIGITAPNSKLDVHGYVSMAGEAGNVGTINQTPLAFLANSGQVVVSWNRTSSNGETDFIGNQGAGNIGGFAFYNHDNNNNETQLMWLLGNGNLLIGKSTQSNSSYKLDVAGSVRANQIVVNTNGADFVFDPTYKLMPLADISKYVNKNHHLPEIASAKDMQANGLNVGENQVKLLQKVEELTLYLIEKDKQIQEQAIEINAQKSINASLEHRINGIENTLKIKPKKKKSK
jgi:hypothetical protein